MPYSIYENLLSFPFIKMAVIVSRINTERAIFSDSNLSSSYSRVQAVFLPPPPFFLTFDHSM